MITAYYTDRRGAGCVRPIASIEDAEKILNGGYSATEVRLEDEEKNIVGVRQYRPDLDLPGNRKYWWYHELKNSNFAPAPKQ